MQVVYCFAAILGFWSQAIRAWLQIPDVTIGYLVQVLSYFLTLLKRAFLGFAFHRYNFRVHFGVLDFISRVLNAVL